MRKFDAKLDTPIDVLVLGEHPCAYLAAALLRQDVGKPGKAKPKLRVVHAALPSEQPVDRLVTVNPALFDLHPLMGRVRDDLPTTPVHGLRFLADDAATASEHRASSPMVAVVRYRQLRDAVAAVAAAEGVEFIHGSGGGEPRVRVHRADETGLDVTVGKHEVRPTALIMAGDRPRDHVDQQAALGLPDTWGADVAHRFTSLRCKSLKHLNLPDKPLMPMSLDLAGRLCWAWLVPGDGEFQLTVEQRIGGGSATAGAELLAHWVAVLQRHGHLGPKFTFDRSATTSVDLPLAGALVHEGVANRTLLIGPAGGFYSACGEDVYPGCWSALFAADVLRKALRQPHLQDALADYRQVWRTTLGDYLRGPQQNLRLLLPLVYRNPVMTARLAEAVLLSKSVVR
jgi:hypothetical protein